MHIHLFEFTDQPWCPAAIRRFITDYLHFVITKAGIYHPAIPILKEVMDKSGIDEIIDLCSGSGGGVDFVQKELSESAGKIIRLTMSDKFPNPEPYELLKRNSNGGLNYINESIDVMHVPENLKGIRTLFSAFHHFNPGEAKEILSDAVKNSVPVCIFEGAGKSFIYFLGILIFTPVIFFFTTPFFKPFSFTRLFFTYIIPIVPVMTTWDGLVSILRMHTPKHMINMTNEINAPGYVWKAGSIRGKLGNTVMYLSGYPHK
jgi:hypothetical protein